MNNYYDQHEDQYNFQGFYANTYSLWQNSRYYDTNNLSLINYTSNEWKNSEDVPIETTPSVSTDSKNRKVVNRETLYKDPNLFDYNDQTQNPSQFGWPQQNWVKAGDSLHDPEQGPSGYVRQTPGNKLEKILNKGLKEPAKMTKAENMMQKMGWQGGALGKTGDGILEPIAPNAAYATTTAGFGHIQQVDNKKKNNEQKSTGNKRCFDTNVLQNILKFVKNDFEVEMVFDKSLWKGERKRVHMMVNEVISSESPEDEIYATEAQADMLRQIHHYNCYLLNTQSEGDVPNRKLTVYKEAPPHVFLITPDDLKEKKPEDEILDMDIDESNPFLKSITKNIKEEINKLETSKIDKANRTCLDRIVDYFIEFQASDEFTELRFLGPFSGDEIESVNKFLNDLTKCIDNVFMDVREDLVKLFKDVSTSVKIYEDVNGSAVVHKVKEN